MIFFTDTSVSTTTRLFHHPMHTQFARRVLRHIVAVQILYKREEREKKSSTQLLNIALHTGVGRPCSGPSLRQPTRRCVSGVNRSRRHALTIIRRRAREQFSYCVCNTHASVYRRRRRRWWVQRKSRGRRPEVVSFSHDADSARNNALFVRVINAARLCLLNFANHPKNLVPNGKNRSSMVVAVVNRPRSANRYTTTY